MLGPTRCPLIGPVLVAGDTRVRDVVFLCHRQRNKTKSVGVVHPASGARLGQHEEHYSLDGKVLPPCSPATCT
jgi:hypothetical protein